MKVVINPKYNFLTDFIYHLPGCFFKDGETIYQGRNILKKHDALLTIRLKFRSVDLELQILLHILR